jgi:DNA-binding LacI/PurR family transcriptional regulator
VAALAGVSRATASRAINGGNLVSPAARAAVEAAVAELGFSPNPAARSLATRRTGSVALVVPEPNSTLLTDPFFGGIINGLCLALDESDLQVVLLVARPGASTDRAARYLTTGHVDGAVVASHHRDDLLNQVLVDSKLPCVFIGRPLDVPRAHYVDMDNTMGARLATEHLIASGRRRIGTVAGPADMTAGIDRLAGWQTAMRAAGRATDAIEYGDFSARSGNAAMARLLDAHPDLDAVFVASDTMASGALTQLTARGVSVPDDLAVFGFDDIGVAETTDPPLSTVAQPVTEMAAQAGRMLEQLLAGSALGPDPVLFEPKLVLRESA